jgi:hypothetical protein
MTSEFSYCVIQITERQGSDWKLIRRGSVLEKGAPVYAFPDVDVAWFESAAEARLFEHYLGQLREKAAG